MCQEERFTLQLLLVEHMNQSKIFKEKTNPILVSLEKGIQKAEKRLQECEYKQCMSQFYDMKLDTDTIKKINLKEAREKLEVFQKCLSLY